MSLRQVTNQLETHFSAFESRGGDYAVMARVERKMAQEHSLTYGGAYGDACVGCGDPWPCAVIEGILAPE